MVCDSFVFEIARQVPVGVVGNVDRSAHAVLLIRHPSFPNHHEIIVRANEVRARNLNFSRETRLVVRTRSLKFNAVKHLNLCFSTDLHHLGNLLGFPNVSIPPVAPPVQAVGTVVRF